jgi:hypothetical protein
VELGTPVGAALSLGDELGTSLGAFSPSDVGERLGDELGVRLGVLLGGDDGLLLGEPLGVELGPVLGEELGEALGEALGAPLGKALGDELGAELGDALGEELGPELGEALGPVLGKALGPALGPELGEGLGPALGPRLGEALGRALGPALGPPLGDELGPVLGLVLGDELGIRLGLSLGVSLGAKLLLGMALGVSVRFSGGARPNGEGVFERSWQILSSAIPTGPFVSISIFVANARLIGILLMPSEPLGETTTSVTISEVSVRRMVTSFWMFSKAISMTSSIGVKNVKVITPVSLACVCNWFWDWTIKTLPIGGIPLGLASPGVPISLLPGLAVSKRRT